MARDRCSASIRTRGSAHQSGHPSTGLGLRKGVPWSASLPNPQRKGPPCIVVCCSRTNIAIGRRIATVLGGQGYWPFAHWYVRGPRCSGALSLRAGLGLRDEGWFGNVRVIVAVLGGLTGVGVLATGAAAGASRVGSAAPAAGLPASDNGTAALRWRQLDEPWLVPKALWSSGEVRGPISPAGQVPRTTNGLTGARGLGRQRAPVRPSRCIH
jgi:hypothetical protein